MKIMTVQEAIARKEIGKMSNEKLIEVFVLTGENEDKNISMVRGWLMDEVELRFPKAFDKWLEQDEPTDESLKSFIS
jgi:hypothetical protein